MDNDMKDHYKKLSAARERKLRDAEELRIAMRQTFEMIYGFPLDVELAITQEFLDIIADDVQQWGTPELGEIARIGSFSVSSDTFCVQVDDVYFGTYVPLNVVRRMIDER